MWELLRLLFIVSRPGSLVITGMMYLVGAGIADFLGTPIDGAVFWLGFSCSILLVFSSHLLDAFFRSIHSKLPVPVSELIKQVNANITPAIFRRIMLQSAATTLTVGAILTVLLITQGFIGLPTFTILGMSFILGFVYAVPPLSISQRGFGEIIEAILVTNFISAFAFLLQTGEIHRLLFMLTIPLTCLMIAMRLALALQDYGEAMVKNRVNMMTILGWEKGMLMHNLLILIAYGLILAAFFFGLPWRLTWPGLLSIPIGLYQIWQMRQIAIGVKPNWNILRLTSISLLGLTAYFIFISLWIG